MIVKTSSVFCDIRGPACVGWVAQTTDGVAAARKEAKRRGWDRHDGLDRCPFCRLAKPLDRL